MTFLRRLSLAVAFVLILSEIARWWGDPRLVPLAFDEVLVGGALMAAAIAQPRYGAAPLAAAWGFFCGLVLALLIPSLDHLLFGPPKESAIFYSAILTALLALGIWATARALRACPRP